MLHLDLDRHLQFRKEKERMIKRESPLSRSYRGNGVGEWSDSTSPIWPLRGVGSFGGNYWHYLYLNMIGRKIKEKVPAIPDIYINIKWILIP